MLLRALSEPELHQGLIELGVPCSWGLTESVEGLDQVEHLRFLALQHEPRRLLDVDILRELTIQKKQT